MTEFKPKETSSTLLASGKSSRLLAMRNKSQNPSPTPASAEPHTQPAKPTAPALQAELHLAQQLIDQQLMQILADLPAGKQRSFFKIRYGMDIDTLKQQPIHRIVKRLKINHPQLTQAHGDMKKVLELTYNGQPSA